MCSIPVAGIGIGRCVLQADGEPAQWGPAEHWVAGPDGVARKVATIRRVPINIRWSPERIGEVTGVSDQPNRALAKEPAPVVVVPVPVNEVERTRRLRRTFIIVFQDLLNHGLTRGCPKFDAFAEGRSVGTAPFFRYFGAVLLRSLRQQET